MTVINEPQQPPTISVTEKKMSDKLFKMLSTNKETQTEDPHVSTAGIIL